MMDQINVKPIGGGKGGSCTADEDHKILIFLLISTLRHNVFVQTWIHLRKGNKSPKMKGFDLI